ncbi:signal peptidase II [Geodermatophilus sp. FMUSA9-8]|uniref:signal peptidase II n=1 Tax=Geodermatophilus sp. FMUSA9-8 TaxID=3120155 RepID=UPI00300A3D6C
MSEAQGSCPRRGRPHRRRLGLAAAAGAVAAVDLTSKAWAQKQLTATGVELGLVDLRLAYNPGVAFSVGAEAPGWLVVAVTAAITAAVAVFAWRAARRGGRAELAALAFILGGAVANLADRGADGVVTDYLHTGWWPTFNLADTAIVTGALSFAVTALRGDTARKRPARSDAAETSPPADPASPFGREKV